jgi:hypothetical protein
MSARKARGSGYERTEERERVQEERRERLQTETDREREMHASESESVYVSERERRAQTRCDGDESSHPVLSVYPQDLVSAHGKKRVDARQKKHPYHPDRPLFSAGGD